MIGLTSRGPLGSPAYRRIWYSSLASAGAQWMERVITGWIALEIGGGALAVGTVFAVRMLPFVLFGLIAGTVADRYPRRSVLMAVALLGALCAAGLALVTGPGDVQLWQLMAISFLGGAVFVFDMPARGALLVDLAGREQAASAIALNAVALRLFGAVGGFAGGLVIPTLGVSNGYLVVAVAHLVGFGLIVWTKVPDASKVVHPTTVPFGRALAETLRLVVEYPAVRMVIVISLVAETFGFSHQAALPTLARDVLAAGPEGLGALTGASSIGATLAVVLLTILPGSVRRQPLVTAVLFAWGVSLLALASSTSFGLSLAIMLLVGGCASGLDTLQQTLVQLAVPEHQRGRAVGVWVFSIGMNLVGLFQVGAVTGAFGAPVSLGLNGVFAMAGALAVVALAPTFRWRRSAGAYAER